MRIFGYEITKASGSSSTARNIPLDTTATGWEKSYGNLSHDDYGGLLKQYKNWVYVGVFKNAVNVARYPLKLYATKKKTVSKIISKHKTVDDSFYKFLENSAHLRKYTIDSDAVVEILEHPVLDLLNQVNPQMNRFDLLSKTIMFMELTGNCYWYLVLNRLNLPEQIWPISPVHIKINIADTAKTGEFISGYTFTKETEKIIFKREEIIHFSFPSPYSNIYGMGSTAAGQDSIKFDNKSREYENILLENQCRPDVILQTDQAIKDADHQSLMGRLRNAYAGKKGLGKWLLLDKGLKATPLNMPLRDMGFVQGRKASKEEIAGILGIPVSKLTTEDVNLANAYAGNIQYITDTIVPRLSMLEEKLNERLMPMYDENLFLSYGNVIPSDRNYRLQELQTHLTTKYSSINEERKKDGLEPVEWGDKPVEEAPPEMAPPEPNKEEEALEAQAAKHWIDAEEEQNELINEITHRVMARLNA